MNGEKTTRNPLPLAARWSPSNTTMPGPTALTTPNNSSIGSCISHTTMQQSPHWWQWDAPNSPSKLPLPLQRSPPPSNTPILRPTPVMIPNGIWIHSVVWLQYTFRTNRHNDRWSWRQVSKNTAYARYTDRERHANNLLSILFVVWLKKF